jgi:hypothetical protein
MTSIPTKVGLTLIGVYWAVMAGMVIYKFSPPETQNLALGTDWVSITHTSTHGGARLRRAG